jgi:pimeloyl-ACP methyl ester carboxylesterase
MSHDGVPLRASTTGSRGGRPRIPVRLSLLVAQLVLTAFATSPAFGLAHRASAIQALDAWSRYFWPLATASSLAGSKAQAYLAGLLLCIQEANLLVRWIVESLGLKPAPPPGDAQSERATQEYSRGRVIGTLERIAVYVLVLQGQYDALGLVLAAKGLARFQNLDNREFAEYFLIGTFLSVVLAGAIALAVQSIG